MANEDVSRTQTERYSSKRSGVISTPKKDSDNMRMYAESISSNTTEDPFTYEQMIGHKTAIKPPFNPLAMVKLVRENSHLNQCIDAMVTNIHGFGYRGEYIGKDGKESSPAAMNELKTLEGFFDEVNAEESFHSLRFKIGADRHIIGNGYAEVIRDATDAIAALHHVPGASVRITGNDIQSTSYKATLYRGGKPKTYIASKRFKRFIQMLPNGRLVYFKEFGDPRTINKLTGDEDPSCPPHDRATEIIHFAKYNPVSPYGLPLFHAQMPSIIGSREAELTNLDFFENNGIPAMAVLVSGGQLTQEAYEAIAHNFDEVKGRGSTNKIIVLEARGALEDSSTTGAIPTPTMTLKPLYAERQNDALFKEYEQNCADKIRSAFRLPPVFCGSAADYTYASAKVSLEIAENQIFIPERTEFDDVINRLIVAPMKLRYWRFRSNPAALATSEDLIAAISAFNDAGAITPNTAIHIINEKLNMDIARIEEFWGDLPFQMVNSIVQSNSSPDKALFVNDIFKTLQALDINTIPEPANTLKVHNENLESAKQTAAAKTKQPASGDSDAQQ